MIKFSYDSIKKIKKRIMSQNIEEFMNGLKSTKQTYHALAEADDMTQISSLIANIHSATQSGSAAALKLNMEQAATNGKSYYIVALPDANAWAAFDDDDSVLRCASNVLSDVLQETLESDRISGIINLKQITIRWY